MRLGSKSGTTSFHGGQLLTTPSHAQPALRLFRNGKNAREVAEREAERLRAEVISAIQQGKAVEFMPWAGQTASLLRELPAAEIMKGIIAETEEALKQAGKLIT